LAPGKSGGAGKPGSEVRAPSAHCPRLRTAVVFPASWDRARAQVIWRRAGPSILPALLFPEAAMRRPIPYRYVEAGWFLAACLLLGAAIGTLWAGIRGAG